MNEIDVLNSVTQFIHSKFPLAKKNGIRESDSLLESGVVDSMGILEIVTFIEDDYSIVLSDDEVLADNFESIMSITKLIANSLQGSDT